MGGVEGNMLHVVCVNYLLTCTSAACWAPVKWGPTPPPPPPPPRPCTAEAVLCICCLLYVHGNMQVTGFTLVGNQDIIGGDIPCDGKSYCQVGN
jgi:hypothetical protein